MHARVEHHVARLAQRLRSVHRGVRIAQEVFWAVVLGRADGDADAGAGEDLLTLDIEGRLQLLLDPLRNPHSVVDLLDALEEDRELVAAHVGDRGAQPLRAVLGAQARA